MSPVIDIQVELAMSELETHYSRRPDRVLYHYTSADGLYGIVNNKTLWATQIQYLNDAKEFLHAVDLADFEVNRLKIKANGDEIVLFEEMHKRLRSSNGARSFIFSLSEEPDLLSQWRAYCSKGGFSIGFDPSALYQLAASNGFRLLPCIYEEAQQKALIKQVIDETLSLFHARKGSENLELLSSDLMHIPFYGRFLLMATSIKHPSFSEEKEWRLIGGPFSYKDARAGWRPRRDILIPYYEFNLTAVSGEMPISDVCVGPALHQDLSLDSAGSFLASNQIKAQISQSAIPYRTE
jgi:hypothetical protein